jgi:RHS repeat-associated protein
LINEFDLNWNDYGARYYNSLIGRWSVIDPLVEKRPWLSTYAYGSNNPMGRVDPSGKFDVPIHGDITKTAISQSKLEKKISETTQKTLVFGATISADYVGAASDWHFDGRKNYTEVNQTWNDLNKDISQTISNIGTVNKKIGGWDIDKLGNLIHNVQDFYSHSNYVELYIEYYKSENDGEMPTSVPTYDEGIKNGDFTSLLQNKLRTGDFDFLDNEKTNPKGTKAQSPTSHNKMNKDHADTPAGQLAKKVAIEHTTKILRRVK